MWPFDKEQKLPGIKIDSQGKLMFELTEEEKLEVRKVFDMLKGPDGEYIAREEAVDEIRRGLTAMGLFNYAKDRILFSGFDSNKNKKHELIEKAIASIAKAHAFCPLPIFMYDLACFMEMNGRAVDAKEAFRTFLKLQKEFRATQYQETLFIALGRDISEAIKDAENRVKY